MREADMHRRRTDQSRLHQLAVNPTVNIATIIAVVGMLFGGGLTFGVMQQSDKDNKEDIEEVRAAVVKARKTAEQAKAQSDTTMQLIQRVESTMSVMQSDIKKILGEMRRK